MLSRSERVITAISAGSGDGLVRPAVRAEQQSDPDLYVLHAEYPPPDTGDFRKVLSGFPGSAFCGGEEMSGRQHASSGRSPDALSKSLSQRRWWTRCHP